MARRQQSSSISLFPFLAVLVCTMGALILLLLVITRQIRNDQRNLHTETAQTEMTVSEDDAPPGSSAPAIIPVAEDPVSPPEPVPDQSERIAEIDQEIANLQESLTDLKDRILRQAEQNDQAAQGLQRLRMSAADATREITEMKDQQSVTAIDALNKEVAALRTQLLVLQSRRDALTAQLESRRDRLKSLNTLAVATAAQLYEQQSALLNLRRQVQKESTKPAASGVSKTVVDFSNTTGTSRLPLMIDVSDAGFEFLPTGIRLTAKDMEGFPVRDNPLLTAILTLHRARSEDARNADPYVLLIVRPDGSIPFYAAQRILAESGIHYGYELLETERTIEAGERDEQEVRIVRDALLKTLNRRETQYAMLQQQKDEMLKSLEEGSPQERRLVMRSDGRVVSESEGRRVPLEGRFYAGGEAPRQPLYKPQPLRGFDALQKEAAARRQARHLGGSGSDPGSPEPEESRRTPGAAGVQGSAANDGAPSPEGAASEPLMAEVMAEAEFEAMMAATRSAAAANVRQLERAHQDNVIHSLSVVPGSSADQFATERNPRAIPPGQQPSLIPGDSASSGKPVDLSRIDPDLMKLLKTRESERREMSTPVGITVFLDAEHMTIGQGTAVRVNPLESEQALGALLHAISDEVESARQHPHEPLLPIVKFIVSPGGERMRIPLARELQQIGIPSASVVEVSPWVVPIDDAGHAVVKDTVPVSHSNDVQAVSPEQGAAR